MKKSKPVKYRVFRIILISSILNVLLIFPVGVITFIKHSPEILKNQGFFTVIPDSSDTNKTHVIVPDSLKVGQHFQYSSDSIQSSCDVDISSGGNDDVSIHVGPKFDQDVDSGSFYGFVLFVFLIISINIPFKIFFRRKRKNKTIPLWVEKYTKKLIQFHTWMNAGLLFSFNFITALLDLIRQHHLQDPSYNFGDNNFVVNTFILTLLSSFLVSAFAFYWMSHRLYFKYLPVVYSGKELKKNVLKFRATRIRFRMITTSIMTALLPLSVVIFYIYYSVSNTYGMNLTTLSPDHIQVLLGNYYPLIEFFQSADKAALSGILVKLPYINGLDTILMFWGIWSSVIITLIFVISFVKWTTTSIVFPVNNLLEKMKLMSAGHTGIFARVYSNDEIGKLTEGYNEMSEKLHNYIGEITDLNKNLENKVIERTATIQMQKEEIEAQRDEIEAQRNMAIDQRDMISQQKKEIVDSINYAYRIQLAMLPTSQLMNSLLSNHFLLYMPRDIVSGDFYWINKKENMLTIVVADCTGHGVPGGFMSMLGITYLDEIINKENISRPDLILNRLRENIILSLKQKGHDGEQKDGMDISLIAINTQPQAQTSEGSKPSEVLMAYSAQWAGANNPLYVIARNEITKQSISGITSPSVCNDEIELHELKGDKMPIAIYERMNPFTNHEISISPDDTLYLFSDGFADQFGGPKGKKYKYKPFKDLLLKNADKPLAIQQEILEETYRNWTKHINPQTGIAFTQIDDICVLGFRLNS